MQIFVRPISVPFTKMSRIACIAETDTDTYTRIFEVQPTAFIDTLSSYLKENTLLTVPEYIDIIKTSHGKENAPANPDWLYVRAASVFRRFLVAQIKHEPITLGRLASAYGCKKDRGARPGKRARASRGHLKSILDDFMARGWIVRTEDGKSVASDDGIRLGEEIIGQIIKA